MIDRFFLKFGSSLVKALAILILIVLVTPTLIVVAVSFNSGPMIEFPPRAPSWTWFAAYFEDSSWISATLFSLQISAMTTVVALVVGTMAAIALVRGNVPMNSALMPLILAPLIVPHIVVAIAVYFHYAPLGLVGTRLGFVLIQSALAVPYVVLMVTAALQGVSPSYEMAALNLGASRLTSFRMITLPLISPALLAAAVFSFITCFDESVVSFFISGIENKTITRKLFEEVDFNLSPLIASASTIFMVGTILVMGGANLVKWRARRTRTNAERV